MRARRRALPDDDVELVVLERGVELFFENGLQAVDFVEEEHLALAQIGEDGGEVALDLQRGAGGLLEADIQLVGDDGGERRFAQSGRPEEEHVIERFAARPGRFKGDSQLLLCLLLADEFPQPARTQLQFKGAFVVGAHCAYQPFWVVFAWRHFTRSLPGEVRGSNVAARMALHRLYCSECRFSLPKRMLIPTIGP